MLMAMCCLEVGIASAQQITATLTGTVTDSTGAVVPGAKITIHDNARGVDVRSATTDSTGVYTIAQLPNGTYTATIEATGFQKYVANDVILHVGDHRALDATLQTGSVTQEVTVTATAAPIQTATAAQEDTVTGTQVRELQLNNRNFEQLVILQPGVASGLPDQISFGITNTDSISVNGARTGANNWTVDGSDVNDSGSNLTLLNVPSVDAISEFKIARGTYDAQYGRSSGGQVAVATKSGTSQFHGDAYEFFRNDILNANTFFGNAAKPPAGSTHAFRPPYRYNDFGYTIGGPFYIPGHYNTDKSKTFFFFSEEFRRNLIPSTLTATLPTANSLNGTFTGMIPVAPAGCVTYNAVANTSQVSPTCYSKNAQAYIANIYSKLQPNFTTAKGVPELITSPIGLNNYRQEIIRVDQKLSDKTQLFARYMEDKVPTTEPGGLFAGSPLPGVSSTSTNAPGRNVVLNVTKEFSPTIVNEAAFNYSWGAITSNITGSIVNPAFYGAITTANFPFTDPYARVPGLSIGGDSTGVTGVGIPVSPYKERNVDKAAYDNLSIVHGNHSIRTGVSFQWMRKSENAVNATNGSFSFNNNNGDPAFANFLLGQAFLFGQANRDIIPDLHFLNFGTYVEDDWKVKSNLTLNLGFRYDYLPTPHDVKGILDNFDPATFSAAGAPAIDPTSGLFVAGQTFTPANYLNGIIVAPSSSPFGQQVNPNSKNSLGPRIGFAWDPFKTGKTSVRGGYGIYYDRTLNGIWEQNQFTNPPFVSSISIFNTSFDNPSAVAAAVSLSPRPLHVTGTPDFKVPSNQQWSLSVQREITANTTVEVAYVGAKGTHLLGEYDANQVPLSVRLANPTVNTNALRPYPGYNVITTIAPMFDSSYNSLQVSVNRRVSHGLNLGVAYTWSKTLSDNSTDRSSASMDTYNRALDYGPTSFSRPQVLVFNYIYDLPFFRSQSGLAGHVLGGWEASGITTIESGFPQTVFQCCDPFRAINKTGIGIDPSPVSPRPDRLAGSLSGPGTVAEWFNTAPFTFASGHFGTSGRGIFIGPGWNNWDFSLFKNTKISERFSTQFRAEFFNVFNHTSFSSVNTTETSPAFGNVTGTHDPRIIQLGLKLFF